MNTLHSYLAYYLLAINAVTFIVYGIDKYKAKHNRWRIPEAFLLGAGFCCGAIGALLGMKVFRHKTKHWYFWVINFIGLVWQLGLGVYIALML